MEDKLLELGFDIDEKGYFSKYVKFKGDRFGYYILVMGSDIIFVKSGSASDKPVKSSEIERNHNNLSNGIKKYWLEELKPLGLR